MSLNYFSTSLPDGAVSFPGTDFCQAIAGIKQQDLKLEKTYHGNSNFHS